MILKVLYCINFGPLRTNFFKLNPNYSIGVSLTKKNRIIYFEIIISVVLKVLYRINFGPLHTKFLKLNPN